MTTDQFLFLFFMVCFFCAIGGVGGILFYLWRQAGKLRILWFDTPNTCRMIQRKPDKRVIKINDKQDCLIGDSRPVQYRTRIGTWQPLFKAGYKSKKLTAINPQDDRSMKPEEVKALGEMAVLDGITKRNKLDLVMVIAFICVGVTIGAIVIFMLGYTGILNFPQPPVQNITSITPVPPAPVIHKV